MLTPALVFRLGLSQLVCWGVSYYLIGVFGDAIAADLGWSLTRVHGGYALALVIMGLCSGVVGRAVDRHGGRKVMSLGSLLLALGCGLLAATGPGPLYWIAWAVLGVAMRCTLYDAAFATLARIGGPAARRPIAQITLLGGLASTVFWPIGHALAERIGWRGAVWVYAAIALGTVLLHARIPRDRWRAPDPSSTSGGAPPEPAPPVTRTVPARSGRAVGSKGWLFAINCALVGFTNAAMSSQGIVLLAGLGLGTAAAVWVSSLRGVAQTVARLADILFGRRWSPLDLHLGAALICLAGFAIGPLAGSSLAAGIAFSVLFGAGNGLLTITRGTVPLQLFAPQQYGAIVGRLIAPGFYLAATAPVVVAAIIEGPGPVAAAWLLFALSVALSAVAWLLRRRVRTAMRESTPSLPPR